MNPPSLSAGEVIATYWPDFGKPFSLHLWTAYDYQTWIASAAITKESIGNSSWSFADFILSGHGFLKISFCNRLWLSNLESSWSFLRRAHLTFFSTYCWRSCGRVISINLHISSYRKATVVKFWQQVHLLKRSLLSNTTKVLTKSLLFGHQTLTNFCISSYGIRYSHQIWKAGTSLEEKSVRQSPKELMTSWLTSSGKLGFLVQLKKNEE